MTINAFFEASVAEGLEAAAQNELRTHLGGQEKLLHPAGRYPGVVQFVYTGQLPALLQLKTVLSLFAGTRFAVPRPRALLGHEAFETIIGQIDRAFSLSPEGEFKTFHLAAAGSDSSVMTRIGAEIAARTGLTPVRGEGDLLVRVRHPLDGQAGWEVLVRLTPRPLSTRKWRVCDYTGALNAAVAQAMVQFSRPTPNDFFFNLTCGSGTLLIERAAACPARRLWGCDLEPEALACARRNIAASTGAKGGRIAVFPWDARALPLPAGCVDTLVADLPFGHDVGSHQDNLALYPAVLGEAARVARPGGRCVLLSHEVRLMAALLETAGQFGWQVDQVIPITINGLHPRIYTLRRLK